MVDVCSLNEKEKEWKQYICVKLTSNSWMVVAWRQIQYLLAFFGSIFRWSCWIDHTCLCRIGVALCLDLSVSGDDRSIGLPRIRGVSLRQFPFVGWRLPCHFHDGFFHGNVLPVRSFQGGSWCRIYADQNDYAEQRLCAQHRSNHASYTAQRKWHPQRCNTAFHRKRVETRLLQLILNGRCQDDPSAFSE